MHPQPDSPSSLFSSGFHHCVNEDRNRTVGLDSSFSHTPYKIHSQILWILSSKYPMKSDHFSLSLVFSPWSKPLSFLFVEQPSKWHTVSESAPRMSPSYCPVLWCAMPHHVILLPPEWKLKNHHAHKSPWSALTPSPPLPFWLHLLSVLCLLCSRHAGCP